MTREEAVRLVLERMKTHPEERYGQAAFNALYLISPSEVDALRGSDVDPFYRDERVDAFLEKLGVE